MKINSLHRISILLLLLSECTLFQSFYSQNAFHFNGYLKSLQLITIPGNADTLSTSNLIHNRLNLKIDINTALSFRLEVRNRIFLGDQLKRNPGFGNSIDQDDDYINLSKLWINKSTLVIHSIIDRMQIQYSTNNWDIRLGRQRINWGIHNYWNPNDLFNTYNFLDFDFEERPGSDAIRIQHFSSDGSGLELAFKPGKNSDTHTAGLLYKFNKSAYDFQLLGGIYKTDLVLGGGWAGGISNTGWKSEFSYFIPFKDKLNSKQVFVFTSMIDQTFAGDWYVSLSGLYQSREEDLNFLTNSINGTPLSAKNLFPSTFSFLTSISKSFSGLTTINVSLLYATNRTILIAYPTISWNAADNLQIDLTGQSYFSKITSAYGSIAHAIYLRARWSF